MSEVATIDADRICLVRLGAFGDTIHALALVNGLRRLYPRAHLSWILEPVPAQIVGEHPAVDELIVFRPELGLPGWFSLAGTLHRAGTFDLSLTPQVSSRSSMVTALVDARIKLGFDWNRSREGHWGFMNRHLPPGEIAHSQDLFLQFLDYLGLDDYVPEWGLELDAEERRAQHRFFQGLEGDALGLVIASSSPDKDWGPARYAEVADAAVERYGLVPLLIGGPSVRERDIAETISSRMHHRAILALDEPVRSTMWKLGGCRVVIAPDTGPLHAAVAMGVPTIGLYGPSNPRRCGPYRKEGVVVIDAWTDPGEEGLVSREFRPGRMDRITARMVLERLDDLLRELGDRDRSARPL